MQAASTIEELRDTSLNLKTQRSIVCYFFESDVPALGISTAAFRAFFSQVLQAYCHDEDILDTRTYAMNYCPRASILQPT